MPERDLPPDEWSVEELFGRETRAPAPKHRVLPTNDAPDRPPAAVRTEARRVDLDRLLRRLPKALAAALVELSSGTPVASATLGGHTPRDFDLLAAATTELFHASTVTSIERMDLEHADARASRRDALQQVIVASEHVLYVFLRSRRSHDLVIAALCQADANLGIALLSAREALKQLDGAS